jgi:16S rRNA (uracil1498-N3)-methyltransferase
LARFGDFIRTKQGYGKILIPTLGLKGEPLKKALGEKAPQDVLVMIGPEGDFTEKEVAEAVQAGAEPVSLGPLVMRSETAAVYALSAIRFHYEEI